MSDTKRSRIRFEKAPVCLLALLLAGCRMQTLQPPAPADDRTKEMAELLRSIARDTGPDALPFNLNEERVKLPLDRIRSARDVGEEEKLRLLYATELLNAGKTQVGLVGRNRG